MHAYLLHIQLNISNCAEFHVFFTIYSIEKGVKKGVKKVSKRCQNKIDEIVGMSRLETMLKFYICKKIE